MMKTRKRFFRHQNNNYYKKMPLGVVALVVAAALSQFIRPGVAMLLRGGYGQVDFGDGDAAELNLQIGLHDNSPNAIKSLAIVVMPNVSLELGVELIVVHSATERSFSGNVSMLLDGARLEFRIARAILDAVSVQCVGNSNNDGDLVYSVELGQSTQVLVWRFVAWASGDFSHLPVVSLSVDSNGSIAESFPNMTARCSFKSDDGESYTPPFVGRDKFRLRTLSSTHADDGSNLAVFAHADDFTKVATFYAKKLMGASTGGDERCSDGCQPVLLALPPPSKLHEYGCRLDGRLAEWWQCGKLGLQNVVEVGRVHRQRVATSVGSSPQPCYDLHHDGVDGRWRRYDNASMSYVDFDGDEWHLANASKNAYRCVSPKGGAVIKEIYVEEGTELVSSCSISVDNSIDKDSQNGDANGIARLLPGTSSVVRLLCGLKKWLIGCDGETGRNSVCPEKTTFIIEPATLIPDWQKARSQTERDGGIDIVTAASIVKKTTFHLAILFNVSSQRNLIRQQGADLNLAGDYNIYLFFRNNISYLAGRFKISHSIGGEEDDDADQSKVETITLPNMGSPSTTELELTDDYFASELPLTSTPSIKEAIIESIEAETTTVIETNTTPLISTEASTIQVDKVQVEASTPSINVVIIENEDTLSENNGTLSTSDLQLSIISLEPNGTMMASLSPSPNDDEMSNSSETTAKIPALEIVVLEPKKQLDESTVKQPILLNTTTGNSAEVNATSELNYGEGNVSIPKLTLALADHQKKIAASMRPQPPELILSATESSFLSSNEGSGSPSPSRRLTVGLVPATILLSLACQTLRFSRHPISTVPPLL